MKSARLIKRAVLPAAACPLPPSSAVRIETATTVRHWVEEHQRNSQAKPRVAFAALFAPTDPASVGATS